MIFPVLSGWLSPRLIPITLLLVAINIFVFIATYSVYEHHDQRIDAILADTKFLETQGAAFAAMIKSDNDRFSALLRKLSEQSLKGDADGRRLLGHLAMRNSEFMSRAESFDFGGDAVALKHWRERFRELKSEQAEHPSYIWGLSHARPGWIQYISYQFSHGGLMHLIFNMGFLLIFGAFVETKLGPSFVALTYVGSGLAGAFAYAWLSGISSSPLVGASAAVSGMIALVGLAWMGRERLKHFYWLLPIEGYFGFAHLPSWLVLLVFLLPDIGGYFGALPEFGSVAFSAHIGGGVFGALIAGAFRAGWLVAEIEPGEPGQPGSGDQEIRRTG